MGLPLWRRYSELNNSSIGLPLWRWYQNFWTDQPNDKTSRVLTNQKSGWGRRWSNLTVLPINWHGQRKQMAINRSNYCYQLQNKQSTIIMAYYILTFYYNFCQNFPLSTLYFYYCTFNPTSAPYSHDLWSFHLPLTSISLPISFFVLHCHCNLLSQDLFEANKISKKK